MFKFSKRRESVVYAVIQHSKEAHEMGLPTTWTGDFLKEIWVIKSNGKTENVINISDYDEDTIDNLNEQGIKIFDLTRNEEIPNGRLGRPLGEIVRGVLEIPKLIGG